MNCRDLERLYERAKDSYKDRKFLYVFPQPDNNYWAVNYDAINCELNSFLRLFSISGGDGQHKISEDGNHQEVWFEVSSDFVKLFEVNAEMLKAVGRMGVHVVYDYPFFKKPASQVEDYQKIGQAWNEQYRYKDEEDDD
jgi:hypothetical protein